MTRCGRRSPTRGRVRQVGNDNRIVGGDCHCRSPSQRAEPVHLLFAQQIVADQDVVDAGIGHDLGFAELLASDALRTGCDLHLRNRRVAGLAAGKSIAAEGSASGR